MYPLAAPSLQLLSRRFVKPLLINALLLSAFPVPASQEQAVTEAQAGIEACCGPASPLPLEPDQALDQELRTLLDHAERTLQRFKRFRLEADLFLGLDADVDDRVIHRTGTLVRNMSALIGALREADNDGPVEGLSALPPAIRAASIRLFLAAGRLDLLMEQQAACGLHDLGLLLGAVETLAIELEDATTSDSRPGPDLHYFFFPDHLPNVVPADGGWLIAVGSRLWQEGSPSLSLVDDYRGTLSGPLEAHRVRAGQAAAVRIEPELVAANAGRCLRLNVTDTRVSGTMPGKENPKPRPTESLPVCIPMSFDSRYKVAGFLEYWTPTRTRHLETKSILFENASCTEDKKVSAGLEWKLHPGGWLTDTGESSLYEAGDASVACAISGGLITCEGELGPSICGPDLRSGDPTALLLEQVEWEHVFSPVEEYPEPEKHHSWALSRSFRLDQPAARVALTIPREEAGETTQIGYRLIVINGGQKRAVFTSPGETVTGSGRVEHVSARHRITANYTAPPDSYETTIELSIAPPACRY